MDLGIYSSALIYHLLMNEDAPADDKYITIQVDEPEEGAIPAWTKEELDVMIGNDFEKPEIVMRPMMGKATDPLSYPIYLRGSLKSFKSGAEASAFALIYLIENDLVKPLEACARHKKAFKL